MMIYISSMSMTRTGWTDSRCRLSAVLWSLCCGLAIVDIVSTWPISWWYSLYPIHSHTCNCNYNNNNNSTQIWMVLYYNSCRSPTNNTGTHSTTMILSNYPYSSLTQSQSQAMTASQWEPASSNTSVNAKSCASISHSSRLHLLAIAPLLRISTSPSTKIARTLLLLVYAPTIADICQYQYNRTPTIQYTTTSVQCIPKYSTAGNSRLLYLWLLGYCWCALCWLYWECDGLSQPGHNTSHQQIRRRKYDDEQDIYIYWANEESAMIFAYIYDIIYGDGCIVIQYSNNIHN